MPRLLFLCHVLNIYLLYIYIVLMYMTPPTGFVPLINIHHYFSNDGGNNMTKKEHMVEINFDADEKLQQKLQKMEEAGYSLETALTNYSDALEYEWDKYIKEYPEVNALYSMRGELIEMINRVDQKIDEFIEDLEEDVEE